MLKKICFTLFALIAIVLGASTWIEKFQGTSFVHENIYGTWWFYILWAILTVTAFFYMKQVKLHKKLSTYMVHISFILILLGAITTALTSVRGIVYLPYDEAINSFTSEKRTEHNLPFSITLTDFKVEYYSGTNAPANYLSYITFIDNQSQKTSTVVSMNNIANFQGYRFYQSEYDQGGSWLSVNRDVLGIPITYSGYFLLALSLLWMLLDPRGGLRKLLRSPLIRASAISLLFCVTSISAQAASKELPTSLEHRHCEALNKLQVVYNDRVMPITTIARDFSLKLLGDDDYRGLSYEQFFWSWLLFPTEWEDESFFEVPQSKKQEFLNLKPLSSYSDFFTQKEVYKLNHYIRNTDQKSQPALYKELTRLNEKVQLVAMLRSGAMVKLFPYKNTEGKIQWYSPSDLLPEEMEADQKLFIQNSFNFLLSAYASGNFEEFENIASKILSYQKKFGENSLLTQSKADAEQLYYSLPITTILYRLCLMIGILSIIIIVLAKKKNRLADIIKSILHYNLIFSLACIIFHISLKWYITDRLPLSNGYDTMVFLGFCIASITLLLRKSFVLFTAMGTILVGFTMLVATIGGLNPQITPLIPVLNSPFLTTHVCFIMLSYALFAFTFINGILALTAAQKDRVLLDRLTVFSRIFLHFGLAFLAVGIFIGAIWANVSWGRYWAWDPKEVWALITMIVYSFPLHNKSLRLFNKPVFFHSYLIISVTVVLMTYFGVNLILGGMHSYVN